MPRTKGTKKNSRPSPLQPKPTEPVNAAEGESNLGHSSEISANNQLGISSSTDPQPLRSLCDSLGLHLPATTKSKIHKGEFVNLGPLLLPPGTTPPSLSLAIVKQGDNRVLGPQETKPPALESIEEWTSAFMVYMSVYLEVHSTRAIEMLKYMDTIRSAAHQSGGMGWRTYDEQFRLKQAVNPAQSWAIIDSELWLRVLLSPRQLNFRPSTSSRFAKDFQQQFRAASPSSSQQGGNVGMCFAYNRNGFCNRPQCQYAHRCTQCKKQGHPAINCQRTVKGRTPNSGTSKPIAKHSPNSN